MKKRHLLSAPAVGALALSLTFGSPGQTQAAINNGTNNASSIYLYTPDSLANQKVSKRQNKRGILQYRKIPMPRAWHRR